jgi:hypothetical protein
MGGRKSYGDLNLGRLGARRDGTARSVGGDGEEAGELRGAVGLVDDAVARDGVGQLVDRVEEGLVAGLGEGGVAGARSRDGLDRGHCRGGRGTPVDLEDAQQVGAEVRNEDELLGGVQNGIV